MATAAAQKKLGGSGTGTTSASSSSVGFTSNTTSGNTLVCVVWAKNTYIGHAVVPTISTPTTAGFSWTLLATESVLSGINGGLSCSVYYIPNASSMASTVTTAVTATSVAGTASTYVEFSLFEISGLPASPTIVYEVDSGSSSAPSTSSLVTSVSSLILCAQSAFGSGNCTAGSGFTLGPVAVTATYSSTEYIASQAAGTVACEFVVSQTTWVMISVSFGVSSTSVGHSFGYIMGL